MAKKKKGKKGRGSKGNEKNQGTGKTRGAKKDENGNGKDDFPKPSIDRFFRLLSVPTYRRILGACEKKKHTLAELSESLEKSRTHLCMHLSELKKLGLILEGEDKGEKNFRIRQKGIMTVFNSAKKFVAD